jgi:hypothetical protein
MTDPELDKAEVRRILGDLTDHQVAEILASGLSMAEIEEVGLLLSGETDHMREMGRLTPKGRDIYNLLRKTDEQWEAER